jgi:hypothetical protein
MALIEKFTHQSTGHRAFDRIRRIELVSSIEEIDLARDVRTDITRYRMQLQLGMIFNASSKTFPMAVQNVKKQIVHELFGDLRAHIFAAKEALFSGDPEAVLKALDDLDSEIRP